MNTSYTATDGFKRENWARSESTEIEDMGEFVAGWLQFLCST